MNQETKQKEHIVQFTETKIKRIFTLVPLIFNHQGIEMSKLQGLSDFSSEKELREALSRLMMFGIPPFLPSDFITIHIDEQERVWLDFPLGLEEPLALPAPEWASVQKLLREELQFSSLGDSNLEELRDLVGRLGRVPVEYEASDILQLKRNIIEDSLSEHLQLEFTYRSLSSQEPEIRRVDPYILFQDNGLSYLIAHCHTRNDIRCFHLERMNHPEILDIIQESTPPDSLHDLVNHFRSFVKRPHGFSVKIVIATEMLPYIRSILNVMSVKKWENHSLEHELLPKKEGLDWLEIVCKIQDSLWFLSILRGMGKEVILLGPKHLQEGYLKELDSFLIPEAF